VASQVGFPTFAIRSVAVVVLRLCFPTTARPQISSRSHEAPSVKLFRDGVLSHSIYPIHGTAPAPQSLSHCSLASLSQSARAACPLRFCSCNMDVAELDNEKEERELSHRSVGGVGQLYEYIYLARARTSSTSFAF